MSECAVCGKSDWIDLDQFRNAAYWYDLDLLRTGQKIGFRICRACGFTGYDLDARGVTENSLRTFYGTDYRNVVWSRNHVTCNRKNEYHKIALPKIAEALGLPAFDPSRPAIADWSGVSFMDVGCAQGSLLAMLRDQYGLKNENLLGTEWSDPFRNFARDEYGIPVAVDPDESRKWDVICLYHVLEHIHDPRAALLKYRSMLTDRGVLYVSTPTWWRYLQEESGQACVDWENLLHLNHVNAFSIQAVKNLLAATGFGQLWENPSLYGYTWIARPAPAREIAPEDAAAIIQRIEMQRRAIEAHVSGGADRKGDPNEACTLFPEYPDAQIAAAYWKENFRSEGAQKMILDRAISLMPDNARIVRQRAVCEILWADAHARPGRPKYGNEVRRAEELFARAQELRPGGEEHFHYLALIEYVHKGDAEAAVRHWKRGIAINPGKWKEYMTYIGHARAGIALPKNSPEAPPAIDSPSDAVVLVAQPKLQGLAAQMTTGRAT